LGAQPAVEVVARQDEVRVIDHRRGTEEVSCEHNPLDVPRRLSEKWTSARPQAAFALPRLTGGWIGYAGYDTVRYLEPEKLPFETAPPDDRGLPDMHFGLYRQMAAFDHVGKVLYAIHHVLLEEHESIDEAYEAGCAELDAFVQRLETHTM